MKAVEGMESHRYVAQHKIFHHYYKLKVIEIPLAGCSILFVHLH